MHTHTVDWLRNVEITADAALAQNRWDTGQHYGANLGREAIVEVLRLFLFSNADTRLTAKTTERLLTFDRDFPVSSNAEVVRVQMGLVIGARLERASRVATAFAIGVKAARMPGRNLNPAVGEIVTECDRYIEREAARLRPSKFGSNNQLRLTKLEKAFAAVLDTSGVDNPEGAKKARVDYHSLLVDDVVGNQLVRLGEESQLLWWLVGEFSSDLMRTTRELKVTDYALVGASEVSHRIALYPPPTAVNALLTKSLSACKGGQKAATLDVFVNAADSGWRAKQVDETISADCRDLLPICTLLEKTRELGSTDLALAATSTLCPGFDRVASLTPSEAASQYFWELSFLSSLSLCGGS